MKINTPFTFKRILSIILGIIVAGFLMVMLSASYVKGTAGEFCMMAAFMTVLSFALIGYGLLGGNEPEMGILPKKENPEDKA